MSQSASRPAWEVYVYLYLCAPVSVILQTSLSLGGECGGRVRSTFVVQCITGYSVLLSVSLVARVLSIALRLQVHTKSGNIMICNRAARLSV